MGAVARLRRTFWCPEEHVFPAGRYGMEDDGR